MFEFITVILAEFIGFVLVEWLFGGVFRGLKWIGYRIFSLFTNEVNLPVSELRKKYDASIWPWIIIFVVVVGFPALLVIYYTSYAT